MKSEGPAKHFILAFVLALVGYVVCYHLIEHRRTRNGPWRVAFTTGVAGVPAIVINQPKLAITNVQISFAEEPFPEPQSRAGVSPAFSSLPRQARRLPYSDGGSVHSPDARPEAGDAFHEPPLAMDDPLSLSLSLSPPRGERVPKAGEEAVRGFKARILSGNSLPATNSPVTLILAQPRPVPYEVPFGKCVFMDTTFLPGTVTFQVFGHEIELLPRVLVIDRQEHAWRPDMTIALPRGPTVPPQARP